MAAVDCRFVVEISLAVSAISPFSFLYQWFYAKECIVSWVDPEIVSEVSFAFFLLYVIWHCLAFGPSVFFLLFSFTTSPEQVLVSLVCGAGWGF